MVIKENTMKEQNKHLNILFSVLLFGGLWGIVEATLGTLLHMIPHGARLIFWSSTTVLLPIAYFLMGACYKKSGAIRSVLYMGVFAGAIKLISALIFKSNLEPALYMLVEAMAMGLALLVFRPKEVISFKGLATFIFASTLYLLSTTFYRIGTGKEITGAIVMSNIEKYVFMYNCVAILYAFAVGAAIYGVIKLAQAKNWNLDSVKKVIYHPAFAGSMAAVAVAVTLVLH